MSNGTALIARRSIRARLGRLIAIAIAIMAGVAFVVGSFVLADTLRSGFDQLFQDISKDIDVEVRSRVAFEDTGGQGSGTDRDPFPAEVADALVAVDGVDVVEPNVFRNALILDADGEPTGIGGAPTIGTSLQVPTLSGVVVKDGRLPEGSSEIVIDLSTAEGADLAIGDQVTVLTDTGSNSFTLVGLVGVGESDGFFGATLAAWDLPTAQDVLGAGPVYDTIDISFAEDADPAAVRAAVEATVPDGLEVIDRETLVEESNEGVGQFIGPVGTGLLIFAFITAFVSMFLINNVFAITIGQRLRELALLRVVGAAGSQVRRMIFLEALVMSLVATVVGIFAGLGVAKVLIGVFNAAGAAFPDMPLRLQPRTILMAVLVGVGFTMAAVIAARAAGGAHPTGRGDAPGTGF